MTALSPGQSPPLLRIPIRMGMFLLRVGDVEHFPLAVLDERAGFQPRVVSPPALADQITGATEAVRIVQNDNEEAARSGALRAVWFFTNQRLAVHAHRNTGAGRVGRAGFQSEDALLACELVQIPHAEPALTGSSGDADLAF